MGTVLVHFLLALNSSFPRRYTDMFKALNQQGIKLNNSLWAIIFQS